MVVWIRCFLVCACMGSTLYADDPPKAKEQAGDIIWHTALYDVTLDAKKHMAAKIVYTVRSEDLNWKKIDEKRNFHTPKPLSDVCLETEDYNNSGYDRGHLRALKLSVGSALWECVNEMEAVVPQTPELNRGPWESWEAYVAFLSIQHSRVDVIIDCQFDDPNLKLPNADEPNLIPSSFINVIYYWDEQGHASIERWVFPNTKEVSGNHLKYKASQNISKN